MATSLDDIQGLYIAYFNRPADYRGLKFWQDAADKAGGINVVANAFAASNEYTVLFANKTNIQIIDQIYLNLFGRHAELDGLNFWSDALDKKILGVGNIAYQIMKGAHDTVGGFQDATAVASKVAAATAFYNALDTGVEATAYDDAKAQAVVKTWLAGITDTATKDAATSPAGLTAITQAAVDAYNNVVNEPQAFALTTGADSFTGKAGNDSFTATDIAGNKAFTVGDKLDGGAGNDTLNISANGIITMPLSATVKNIETANLASGTTASDVDTTAWTGLTALNFSSVGDITLTAAATTDVTVSLTQDATGTTTINGGSTLTLTETGSDGGTINIGATTAVAGAVNVTANVKTAAATGDTINVTGGTIVNVTQVAGNAVNTTTTAGTVNVTGNALTTTVSVKDSAFGTAGATVVGHNNGNVNVLDSARTSTTAAGHIATVSLENFAAGAINSSALTTVSLAGDAASLTIDRGNLTATPTANVLTVNVKDLDMSGALTDNEAAADDGFTTLNIVSTGAGSSVGSLVFADATTLNISGSAAFSSGAETLTSLTSVVVTNTAGATLTTALAAGVAFTGGAGDDAISLGATTKAITMGAGNDTVTTAGLVGTGGSVDAGAGIDTIVMTDVQADAADASAVFNSKFTGFEVLSIATGAGTTTLDMAGINAINKVIVDTATALTLNNISTGGTLTITGTSTLETIGVANATFNAADVFNIAVSNAGAALNAGTVAIANVETININTVDTGTGASAAATIDQLTLQATSATKIVVAGNNGLTLVNTANVAVTSFDASGVVSNSSTDTAANLAVTFTSANTTGSAAITIIGGAGNDTLSGNTAVANSNTITGGNGADTIISGLGNDTINLTETVAAADTVVFATTASNGIDTIIGFAAGASGADLARLVSGATSNVAQATAGIADFAASTNTTLTNGATAFALTGGNTSTDDIIEINATLSSFGNLSAAGIVDGAELLKALSSTNVAATSLTADAVNDDFYVVAYQNGNAYLYQVTNGADTTVLASEIALVGVFNGVAAGAFVAGDFTV